MRFIVLGVVVLVGTVVGVVFIMAGKPAPRARPMQAPRIEQPASVLSDAKRQERKAAAAKVIEKLQREGVIGDVDVANRVGKMIVLPKFHALPFDSKQTFANAVMLWCEAVDPSCDVLVIRDSRTNKDVGRFGKAYGGLKID